MYNRKPIILLDDVLKGLDADTSARCFEALLGPGGLLRRNRTAVVLATHNSMLFLARRLATELTCVQFNYSPMPIISLS